MTVKELTLQEFTAFENAAFEFSPGVNVLLGPNATGKSHVMKAIYSVLKVADEAKIAEGTRLQLAEVALKMLDKLVFVFKPDRHDATRLVRMPRKGKSATIDLNTDLGRFSFEMKFTAGPNGGGASASVPKRIVSAPCIFLPTRETLTMYEGFIAAYDKRELSFDETYYDLCVAMSASRLKTVRPAAFAELAEDLLAQIGGKVKLKGERFYVGPKLGRFLEAHLVAEGYRKLACVAHLILNGSITKDIILFWDEPEANLNPNLVTTLTKLLMGLAAEGVQVFVATHDYLLSNELSLAAEYETEAARKAKIRFHGLYREKPTKPVQVQTADTLAGLDQNPILDEFAAHYDREQRLFSGNESSTSKGGRP